MKPDWKKLVEQFTREACAKELSPTDTAKILKAKFTVLQRCRLIDGFTATITKNKVSFTIMKKEGLTARKLDICIGVE